MQQVTKRNDIIKKLLKEFTNVRMVPYYELSAPAFDLHENAWCAFEQARPSASAHAPPASAQAPPASAQAPRAEQIDGTPCPRCRYIRSPSRDLSLLAGESEAPGACIFESLTDRGAPAEQAAHGSPETFCCDCTHFCYTPQV